MNATRKNKSPSGKVTKKMQNTKPKPSMIEITEPVLAPLQYGHKIGACMR